MEKGKIGVRLKWKAFQTKVAQRIFVLFMLSAALPVTALAAVSYLHMRNQLLTQAEMRLSRECKALSVSLYERLWLVNAELPILGSGLRGKAAGSTDELSGHTPPSINERFCGAVLIRAEGTTPLLGSLQDPPVLTASERRHLEDGQAVLSCRPGPNASAWFFMSVLVDPDRPEQGILTGEIQGDYLWEAAARLPAGIEVVVLDRNRQVLHSSGREPKPSLFKALQDISFESNGSFEWSEGRQDYFSNYRVLFLAPRFLYPAWIIVVSERKDTVLAAVSDFTKVFPVIAVISLGMVFFLSFHLVRKNTVPIEILRDATRKIADGHFGHKAEIRSGDEFEGLADAFNEMGERIEKSQALMVRTAKFSTMGQMAAGIMHEVKQPLTAISGILQLTLMDGASEKTAKRLETALQAVDRMNGILTRFKSFSHMTEKPMERVSVNEVLDQVLKLLSHQLAMGQVRCEVQLTDHLPHITGDSQALQQVFSNLILNASDALEGKDDGERIIRVNTRAEDGKVIAEVEDNGSGIPPEIREKIFDPFFTTKPPEKGTGLGLAIIASILNKHHASIKLKSSVGMGTRFTLAFSAWGPEDLTVPGPEAQTGGKDIP